MLARSPLPAVKPVPRPKTLNRDRQKAVREKIIIIMNQAEPTPFAAEGSCRAGIRAALCLQGWPWPAADKTATDLVEGALRSIGAVRPTWKQGQPEWTQDGVMAVQYERCRNCADPLPEGYFKFCCRPCADAHRGRTDGRWMNEQYVALQAAALAARIERRPTRFCERCGSGFKPKHARQTFCSVFCVQASKRDCDR